MSLGRAATEVIFETHSTTLDNEAGVATGWLPGELSPIGRRQAAELGRRRLADDIAVVFSSDLARAVETTRIAFGENRDGFAVRQDPRLRECDYGDLNGSPVELLEPLRPLCVDRPFPGGGQSYREVVEVVDAFLQDLVEEWSGSRVLLIGHSATRWALDCLLAGARLEDVVADPGPWRPGWHYLIR